MTKLVVVTETPLKGKPGAWLRETMDAARVPADRTTFLVAGDGVRAEVPDDAEWLILSGNAALACFVPNQYTGECHGRPILFEPAVVAYPVFHHEACWRKAKLRPVVAIELERLHLMAVKHNWADFIPATCVRCRAPAANTDRRYVRYCDRHWRA